MLNKIDYLMYLLDKCKDDENKIAHHTQEIEEFHAFLSARGINDTQSITSENAAAYIIKKREQDSNIYQVIDFIKEYARFFKNEDVLSDMVNMSELPAIANKMSKNIREMLGEEIWQKVFGDVRIPDISCLPGEASNFAREVNKRLCTCISQEQSEAIYTKNYHGIDVEWDSETDKDELFLEIGNIDKYIDSFIQDDIKGYEWRRDNGELSHTSEIDDAVVEYVKANPWCRREGNKIIIKKLPFLLKKYMNATDNKMKRYYTCHCPLKRNSILQNAEPLPRSMCYCSFGFMKLQWDIAFGRELTGRVVKTVMEEDCLECIFEIDIPDDIMEQYT